MVVGRCRLKHIPKADGGDLLIRYLNPNQGLAGNRRLNPNILGGQRQGQVVSQVGNSTDFDPDRGPQFILGNGRAKIDVFHRSLYPKGLKGRLQGFCIPLDVFQVALLVRCWDLSQQVQRWQLVVLILLCRYPRHWQVGVRRIARCRLILLFAASHGNLRCWLWLDRFSRRSFICWGSRCLCSWDRRLLFRWLTS